jgi:sulfur-oxidizing protein SoxX
MGRIITLTSLTAAALATVLAVTAPAMAAEEGAKSAVETGKQVAFDRKKGNCLACHAMDDGQSPGTIGPPLVAMQMRYPDKAKLRSQIWDPTKVNPNTAMPPFGRHAILSEKEIDQVVEYVWSL